MDCTPNICLVHPNPGPECETFIKAQAQGLPGVTSVLYGGHMPLHEQNGTALHPEQPNDAANLFSPDGKPHSPDQIAAVGTIADYMKVNNIDVVLAEYGPTGVALTESCRQAGVPLVVHFHGFDASLSAVLKKYRDGYTYMFKHAQAVISVSQEMRNDLLRLGCPESILSVNPYGVDADMFASANPDKAQPHFIAVGRFVDKKSPSTVIRAFANVIKKIPNATLTMVGDGVLRKGCIDLATRLNLEDFITFTGSLPHEDVAELMRAASCFVQHSVTPKSGDKEGTPNSILEASASGLPVVATRHAGIPEAIIHEKSGLLCAENDLEAMTENMITIAEDSKLAAQLGQFGRQHIMKHYNSSQQLSRLHTILTSACTRQGQNNG